MAKVKNKSQPNTNARSPQIPLFREQNALFCLASISSAQGGAQRDKLTLDAI
jgi:hypothetical protein